MTTPLLLPRILKSKNRILWTSYAKPVAFTLTIVFLCLLGQPHSAKSAEDQTRNSVIFGYTWGSREGNKIAIEMAKKDESALLESIGPAVSSASSYRIGLHFWRSLMEVQTESDHKAGDGLYFSAHPFNSQRFGPDLLIVEVRSKEGMLSKIINSSLLPEQLDYMTASKVPTILKYRGNWFVVKKLWQGHPESLEVTIRRPTPDDADRILQSELASNNVIAALDVIQGLMDHITLQTSRKRSKKKSSKQSGSTELFLRAVARGAIDILSDRNELEKLQSENVDELTSKIHHILFKWKQNEILPPAHLELLNELPRILRDTIIPALLKNGETQSAESISRALEFYRTRDQKNQTCQMLF